VGHMAFSLLLLGQIANPWRSDMLLQDVGSFPAKPRGWQSALPSFPLLLDLWCKIIEWD
jgi:hypothetical protein